MFLSYVKIESGSPTDWCVQSHSQLPKQKSKRRVFFFNESQTNLTPSFSS
ncbi:hypothetical protein LguiA_011944 [Lonicera macranthoides]